MINKIRRILVSEAGFSITETLVAMLIMLMVSSIVVGGIPVAQRAYQKVTEGANAQVLLSTTITELRNELGLASDVSIDGTTVTYRSGANGAARKLTVDASKGIMLQTVSVEEFTGIPVSNPGTSVTTPTPTPRLLVTNEAAAKNLVVRYESVEKGTGIITFKKLTVRRSSSTQDLISLDELSIDLILE